MTLKEIMENAGCSYDITLNRFSNNEALLRKFVLKLGEDPTFGRLEESVEAKDYREVEIQAHTLKGLSANLGFDPWCKACSDIVSAVRAKNYDAVPELFDKARKEYEAVIACINKLKA